MTDHNERGWKLIAVLLLYPPCLILAVVCGAIEGAANEVQEFHRKVRGVLHD